MDYWVRLAYGMGRLDASAARLANKMQLKCNNVLGFKGSGFLLALLVLCGGWQPGAFADSGGYSRPSSGGYSAPSYSSSPSYSNNGGYSRPPPSSNSYGFSSGGGGGGGDRAISRQNSGQALQNYRAANAPPPQQRQAPVPSGYGNSWGQPGTYPAPPPAYTAGPRQFGAWDAVTLWALLESVNTQRSNNFFAQNQNDPNYLKWRAEMNRVATSDPQVAGKLAQLDRQLGGAPVGAMAASAPVGAMAAASAPGADTEGDLTMLILFVGIAVFAGLWFMRRRARARAGAGRGGTAPAGIGGSSQSRFRVGMTMPLDPAPFILAGGTTKVAPPAEGSLVSVEAIGLVADGAAGNVSLHRLYLPGRNGFFALHLDRQGAPDECRYFSLIDQVTPASQQDWAFWLDPAQGMIGWPEFQTKDGMLYGRLWAGGSMRVPPREQTETIQDLSGNRSRALHAMLYGRATGAPAPAPATEYILVEAIEQENAAWVEIHAGIDINPAALSLPPVAFA